MRPADVQSFSPHQERLGLAELNIRSCLLSSMYEFLK